MTEAELLQEAAELWLSESRSCPCGGKPEMTADALMDSASKGYLVYRYAMCPKCRRRAKAIRANGIGITNAEKAAWDKWDEEFP